MFRNLNRKGFTLIELLIVITVVGVLAGGLVVAIDPVGKINLANIAKSETFDAFIQNNLSINLVGEWKLDQETTIPGPPIKVKDTSGYGNDGTVNGAVLIADRKGQNNKAYSFDGVDDYIQMSALSSDPQAGDYTVTWWVYPFNFAETSWAGVTLGNDYTAGFTLALTRFLVGHNGTYSTRVYSLDWEQWQFVTVTHTQATKTFKFFKNGTSLAADLTYTGTLTASDRVIKLGTYNNVGWGYNVKAYIDDVRIYSQALTAGEIQQMYAESLPKHQLVRN